MFYFFIVAENASSLSSARTGACAAKIRRDKKSGTLKENRA